LAVNRLWGRGVALKRLRRRILPKPFGLNGRYNCVARTGLSVELHASPARPSSKGSRFHALPPATNGIRHFVDQFSYSASSDTLSITGWAVPTGAPLFDHEVSVALIAEDGQAATFPATRLGRADVRAILDGPWTHNSGFTLRASLAALPAGHYELAVVLHPLPWLATLANAKRMLSGDPAVLASGRRLVRTRAELDVELRLMEEARTESLGAWMAYGSSFAFAEDVAALPGDPYSAAYRDAQLKLYRDLAGVARYDPWATEPIPISEPDEPVESFAYPYRTRAAEHIGNHYISVGHILRALSSVVAPGGKILEYGPGEGFTTIAMASSGYQVSAIDINAQALHIVDLLAKNRDVGIRTLVGEFGAVPEGEAPFDAVLFYESFHHCLDFLGLVRKLGEVLSPQGVLVFAGEPVTAEFPKPWGLRLDGGALWEICTNGWLELGFQATFFEEMLGREGWVIETRRAAGSPDIRIARRQPAHASA